MNNTRKRLNPLERWLIWNVVALVLGACGYYNETHGGYGTWMPLVFYVPAVFIYIYTFLRLRPSMEKYLLGDKKNDQNG